MNKLSPVHHIHSAAESGVDAHGVIKLHPRRVNRLVESGEYEVLVRVEARGMVGSAVLTSMDEALAAVYKTLDRHPHARVHIRRIPLMVEA